MTAAVPGPDPVELADGLVEVLFEADPLRASLLGFHDRDAELPDLSDDAERALAGRLRELAAAAGRVDRDRLDRGDRLTADVVRVVAADGADVADTRRPEWQITDLWEGPAAAVLLYLPMVSLSEPAHADAYVQRLRSLDTYLGTAAERHLDGVEAGRLPVARLVRAAVEQVDNYLAAPDLDPLRGVEPPAGWDGADRFGRKLDEVLADVVRPAFGRYRVRLADALEPLSRSDEHVGLCWLPDGDGLYRTLARTHTTTSRTPEDLHAAGLDLVARLAEEYAELGTRMFGLSDPAEVMRRLRDDPTLRCANAEEMLEEARRAVTRAEAAAPLWFARLPGQPCAVRAVPAAEAARAPLAYYMPASLDGSRPGTYWQNTRDPTGQSWHTLQFTAYHEAVPGHHFQNALAQAMPEAPLLRRIVEFDAFDEGWALYSEPSPTRWASTPTTSPDWACSPATRCAQAGSSSTPECTRWAGPAPRRWSSSARTRRSRAPTSRSRSTDTSPCRARHWPTWSAGWRSSGCGRTPRGGWAVTSTSAPSTTPYSAQDLSPSPSSPTRSTTGSAASRAARPRADRTGHRRLPHPWTADRSAVAAADS